MDIKTKKLPKSEVLITIELTSDEYAQCQKQACERISNHVKIDGFRQGKAPYSVLVQKYGEEAISMEAQEIATQKGLIKAVKEEGIEIVTRPEIEVKSKKEPFQVEIKAGILPEIKVDGYEKIKIKAEKVEVKDPEIQEVIEKLQTRNATFAEVDRAAKKGDRVEVDFEGFDEKKEPLEGTKSKNHPIVIGDGMFIPGFEENLEKMKKDEEKEFTLTFPKDYHKEDFQNKKVTFKVQVKMIEERSLPEVNEEFIEKITGQKMKLEELKTDIKNELTINKQNQQKQENRNQYLEELVKAVKADFPEKLIEEEAGGLVKELKHKLAHQKKTFESFLKDKKTTEDKFRKEQEEEGLKRLKLRYGLKEVLKAEKVSLSHEEVDNEIAKIKAQYPASNTAEINKYFKKGSRGYYELESELLMNKLFDKVLSE